MLLDSESWLLIKSAARRQTVPFKWMTPEQIASLAETARCATAAPPCFSHSLSSGLVTCARVVTI
eukprot:3935705-Rhodomonas_salina.2